MAYLSYEQVTLTGGAVKTVSNLTVPSGATHAEIQSKGSGNVKYTMDGATNPTTSTGMTLVAGNEPKTVLIADLKSIRFCDNGTDTALDVHYFKG